jgi:hypothetical protein
VQIVVTPPGTFVVFGRVREPGAGSLAGVRVTHLGTGLIVNSQPTTGNYSFGGVTTTRLAFAKADYEPVEADGVADNFFDVPMQRVYRIGPESTSSQVLAPNDMDYSVAAGGPGCSPCHLVRLTSATAGTINVRVTWDDNGPPIHVWLNGQMFPAGSPARETVAALTIASGESLLYVGRTVSGTFFGHTTFTVTTGAVAAGDASRGR